MYKVILASESPRRKEIMTQMGINFEVVPAHVKEDVEHNIPSKMVEALAMLKAKDVADRLKDEKDDLIIIGADTLVFHKGQVLGKPKDRDDAISMINSLSGDIHEVCTGVSIIIRNNSEEGIKEENIVFSVSSSVVVHPLTIEEIEDYVDTGEPYDKAGAYAIQGGFGIYIKEIHGDYYNIVGFPISKIYEKLKAKGINIKNLK